MVMCRPVRRAGKPARDFAHRSRERGATLFVVLLVILLLMGIGVLSARSAQLATQASGSERQMTQARYVAEYGLQFAAARLGSLNAGSYLNTMIGQQDSKNLTSPPKPPPKDLCFGQVNGTPGVPACRTCARMRASDFTTELGFPVCDQMNAQGNATCDFEVELTDLTEGPTASGANLSGEAAQKYYYVTGTSTGQVLLSTTANPSLTQTAVTESAGIQTVRSRLVAGPVSQLPSPCPGL